MITRDPLSKNPQIPYENSYGLTTRVFWQPPRRQHTARPWPARQGRNPGRPVRRRVALKIGKSAVGTADVRGQNGFHPSLPNSVTHRYNPCCFGKVVTRMPTHPQTTSFHRRRGSLSEREFPNPHLLTGATVPQCLPYWFQRRRRLPGGCKHVHERTARESDAKPSPCDGRHLCRLRHV